MEYRVLGPVEVVRDGEPVDLGVRQRALVALLLIDANHVVSTDHIVATLWGDDRTERHRNALWVVVSRLRSLLEPDRPKRTDGSILLTRPPGYVLAVEPDLIDAHRFEALAAQGRALIETDPVACSRLLSDALALWRGHALEEFTYASFAAAEIARLEELRLTVLEDRIDADLRSGQCRAVVGELESLVRQHPDRERLVCHLMVALHCSGRQGEALRAFGNFRSHLAEIGLEPSDAIVQLEERIVLDDPSLRSEHVERGAIVGDTAAALAGRGYELRDQIGRGSIGDVFTAYQPAIGRHVAVKVLDPALVDDRDFLDRFEAENRVVEGIEHPHIVPIYDYWRDRQSAFLVMRRLDGGTLTEVIGMGATSVDTARKVVAQIGRALAAAHDRGIAHGEVRPGHVLFDRNGDTYLSDFGGTAGDRSRPADEEYIAPEQLRTGVPSPVADLYALGVIARRLLPVDAVGPAVRAALARACAIDVADRWSDVREFVREWDGAFENTTPPDRAAGWSSVS